MFSYVAKGEKNHIFPYVAKSRGNIISEINKPLAYLKLHPLKGEYKVTNASSWCSSGNGSSGAITEVVCIGDGIHQEF